MNKMNIDTSYLKLLVNLNTEEIKMFAYAMNNICPDSSSFILNKFDEYVFELEYDSKDALKAVDGLIACGLVKRKGEDWFMFNDDFVYNKVRYNKGNGLRDYRMQYDTKEWKERREEILTRDNHSCVKCGKEANVVHHKVYKKGFSVWEYPDEYLQSLCNDCHGEIHKIYKAVDLVTTDDIERRVHREKRPNSRLNNIDIELDRYYKKTIEKLYNGYVTQEFVDKMNIIFPAEIVKKSEFYYDDIKRIDEQMNGERRRKREEKRIRKEGKEARDKEKLAKRIAKEEKLRLNPPKPKKGSNSLKKQKDLERKLRREQIKKELKGQVNI